MTTQFLVWPSRRRIAIALAVIASLAALHLGWYVVARIGLHQARSEALAAGLSVDPASVVPPGIPAEDNAAEPYLAAISLLTADGQPYIHGFSAGELSPPLAAMIKALDRPEAWLPAAADQRRAVLAALDEPALVRAWALLAEGARRPGCRFPIDYLAGPRLVMTHVMMRHRLTRIGMVRARLLAAAGAHQDAANLIADLLWMRRQQAADPLALALPDLNLEDGLRLILADGGLAGAELSRCRAAIAGIDHRAIVTRTISGEVALMGQWVYQHLEVAASDQDGWLSDPENPFLGLYRSWPAAPVRVADQAAYLRLMTTQLRVCLGGDPLTAPGRGATCYPVAEMLMPGTRGWISAPLRQRLADAAATALALAAGETPAPPTGVSIRRIDSGWEVVCEPTDPSPETTLHLAPWRVRTAR